MWLNKRKEELQLNLTPLIDVVFLLLIFFMVSTSFKKENKLSINLPEANGEVMESNIESIDINVNSEGIIFVNGQGLANQQLDTIGAAIGLASSDTSLPVIISADKKAPYESVVKVMEASGSIGFTNIVIATQTPDR